MKKLTIYATFNEEGISFPFPQLTILNSGDKVCGTGREESGVNFKCRSPYIFLSLAFSEVKEYLCTFFQPMCLWKR